MIKKQTFAYDEFSDRLMIFNNKVKEPVFGSVNFLNLVIDFTANNKVANVEIRNVSKLLHSLDINPKFLSEMESARIVMNQVRGGYIIYFLLQEGERIEKIPFNIATDESIPIAI